MALELEVLVVTLVVLVFVFEVIIPAAVVLTSWRLKEPEDAHAMRSELERILKL